MAHQGAEGILSFLKDPKNKPLRDLIELAASEDEEALNYVEFIQEEIAKKFKSVADGAGALDSIHLSIKLDAKDGQEGIRAIDQNITYFFNEYGVLKNEKKTDNELSFEQYEKLGEELTFYMFHILIHKYKFKAKVVGNQNIAKKKKTKKNDFKFKTVLFSPKFERSDCIVVIIPPLRGLVSYHSLAIDEGLAYGTMLPYIEKILSWNPKPKKKKKGGKKKKSEEKKTDDIDNANQRQNRWGIMVLDPQGVDANNNKYSIIKIYDKWLSKRIPSVGLFGGFHPNKAEHARRGSEGSILSAISGTGGSGPRIKVEIKNLYFIGGLHNGELISHLLHRRGQSVEKVIKGCIFLGSDDPYDANDVTKSIYKLYGVNYLNSPLPLDAPIEGKKMNGDPYIIRRISSGNPRYCCQSAYRSIIKFLQDSLLQNDEEDDEYKKD